MSAGIYSVYAIPKSWQLDGGRFLISRSAGFLSYATGTGKTLIEILVAAKLLKTGEAGKFLFFGTKTSVEELKSEFGKFTGEKLTVVRTLEELRAFLESPRCVAVMPYNCFALCFVLRNADRKLQFLPPVFEEMRSKFLEKKVGVCLDELQSIKNSQSLQGKIFRLCRGMFCRCYGFTATAITSDLEDLYWIVDFISPGFLGGEWEFGSSYLNKKKQKIRVRGQTRTIWKTTSYKNLEELQKRLAPIMMTFYPEKDVRFNPCWTELGNWEQYRKAAAGILFSQEPLGYAHRMYSIQEVVNKSQEKHELFLRSLKDRISQGALVFCSFYKSIAEVEGLLKDHKVPYQIISGKATGEDRTDARDWFCADPRNKVLILTMAGGQSLNLQATPNVILFDIPHSIGKFIQLIGRVVRIGSEYTSFNIDILLVRRTIDEYKYRYIQLKRALVVDLFNNRTVPPTAFEGFNSVILDALKRDLLWKK